MLLNLFYRKANEAFVDENYDEALKVNWLRLKFSQLICMGKFNFKGYTTGRQLNTYMEQKNILHC